MGRGFPGLKAQSLRPANQKQSFVFLGLRPVSSPRGQKQSCPSQEGKESYYDWQPFTSKGWLTI